jgi:glycosidase
VFNHASRGFFPFNDLLENGPASPWRDWFIVHDWPLNAYGADGAINYEAWWGLAPLPEFNTENPEVREFLMGVGEHWARLGIDGWRLDVPAEITTERFWEEFRERTRAVNPDLYLVGEIWHDASEWVNGGDRFDGTMNYLFTSYTVSFAANRHVRTRELEGLSYQAFPPIDALSYGERIRTLLRGYRTEANLANLNLLGSHDTPRLFTIAGEDTASVILSALLLFTFPGAPSVYYGEEIGLPGHRDPDCRRGFPWDQPESWNREILEAYRSLISLRRAHPALRSTDYRQVWPAAGEGTDMLYLFIRRHERETLLVAVNAGDETEVAAVSRVDLPGSRLHQLWGDGDVAQGDNAVRISMKPRSGAVWRLES